MFVSEFRDQVQRLREVQGFHLTLEQRLAYLVTEVGEVAEETLKLSGARGEIDRADTRERLGMEIYDTVWNLFDLADIAGVDLEGAFEKKARLNEERRW
ncbi:MAG: hypothetical protein H0V53_01715 [Rubrobacter sp.]|nr:hypothetical protein [Rubrobacter sp.]